MVPLRLQIHVLATIVAFAITLSFQNTAASAEGAPIRYRLSFENADHHEAEVTVTFTEVTARVLEVRMSRTSPGRYALHEFAKNIYNVRAFDGQDNPLPITRPNPHQWDIDNRDGTVRVQYTIFGNRADGTYLGIDNTHAHINVPATFMWARGLESRPIQIKFQLPDDAWRIATQLIPGGKPDLFTAPDLAYFMDSPIEIGPFHWREWKLETPEQTATIRLALHHEGTEQETDVYMKMSQTIINEEIAVFGEAPQFDYGTYTFIADYLPQVSGDGMEHRNSTILTSTQPLKTHAVGNLYTVAHEFFHAWNVERMRPKSLEPFHLEQTNMSGELWFAEGFTSYYHALILKRSGFISLDRYCTEIENEINTVFNSPGHRFRSPIEMSLQAPFRDAATSVDPTNSRNTFISYYPYGAVIGLALDLTLRAQFPGKSLDTLMRTAWNRYGKPEIPYSNKDLRTVLGEETGDADFARSFFGQYIEGRDLPPIGELLEPAGLLLRPAQTNNAWIGSARIGFTDGEARIRSATLIGKPLYLAGLDRNDVLLTIDDTPLTSQEQLEELVETYRPGATVDVKFEKNGEERTSSLTFQTNPRLEVVPFEFVNQPVTPDIISFRNAWFNSKTAAPDEPLRRYCPKCRREFPFEYEFCHFDGEALEITKCP